VIRKSLLFGLVVLLVSATAQVRADSDNSKVIQGGGTTYVTGGSGTPPAPVITKLGFHWRDGVGKFECLALVPSEPAGQAGSGNFDTNVMYVTGKITSAQIQGPRATLTGIATVTGLGKGTDVPFIAVAEAGGPGTRLTLTVSGLTFDEVVIEGAITF
jgi:hypothetical protein